jgi:hypothetical protein
LLRSGANITVFSGCAFFSPCVPKAASHFGPSSWISTSPAGLTASTMRLPSLRRSSGSSAGSTATFGMPRLRASSCTCESGLPAPAVRMPATGGSSDTVSGSR